MQAAIRTIIRAAGFLAVAAVLSWASWGETRTSVPQPEPQPAIHIPVAPLGFLPPSKFYLTYRLSSVSLGFIDDDHLLFTFRIGGLLRRLPSDEDGDDDQEIRAVVLDLKTGQVIRRAEWRMHDRSQYLWPVADGKFLLRIRDRLYLTDESLVLQPYLSFPTGLRAVQITPNRQMMVVEHNAPPRITLNTSGDEAPQKDPPVKVDILPPGSKVADVTSQMTQPRALPLMENSFLEVLPAKQAGVFAVASVPFHGKPHILAEMKADCQPDLQPVSSNVVLLMGCYQGDADRPIVAISAQDGKELWQDSWGSKYVWGWFTYAENGSRFAYESLEVNRPVTLFDALDASDVTAQMAGVYDTATGKLVLVRDASPVLTAGQNIALSPDGTRFAILRRGAVEIYDLPPVSHPAAAQAEPQRKNASGIPGSTESSGR